MSFKKCIYGLLVGLFVLSFHSNAQGQVGNVTATPNGAPLRQTGGAYTNVNGSPYFDEEWKNGTITVQDGKEYIDQIFRYNTFKQLLEFKKDGQVFTLAPGDFTEAAYEAEGISYKIQPSHTIASIETTSPLVIVLKQQDGMYLIKTLKTTIAKNTARDFGTSSITESYSTDVDYFIVNENGSIEFRNSKGSFIKAFDKPVGKELKKVIKKYDLDIKKDEDLVVAFDEYLNML